MIDECRKLLERICFQLQRQGQIGYARFMQGVLIRPVEVSPVEGEFIACVRPQADRFIIDLFWPAMEKMPLECIVEILKHEVIHIVNGHASNLGLELIQKYGPKLANIAADLVVNQYIDTDVLFEHKLQPLTINAFDLPYGQTTVYYAEKLLERAQLGFNGMEQGILSGHKPLEVFIFPEDPIDMMGAAATQARLIKSCQNNLPTKLAGWDTADSLEVIAALERPPTIDWQTILRRLELRHMSSNKDTTWRRPSRRMEGMPGRIRKPGKLKLWVCVDASGSMTTELSLIDAELKGIVNRGAAVKVLQFDMQIAQEQVYDRYSTLTEFHGRGGTCFTPIFSKLAQVPLQEVPDVVVIYTDGWGHLEWPDELGKGDTCVYLPDHPKPVDILWLLTPGSDNADTFTERIGACGQVLVLTAS